MAFEPNPNNISNGDIVESKMQGIQGLAVGETRFHNGMIKFLVSPYSDDIKERKAYLEIDAPELTVLDAHPVLKKIPYTQPPLSEINTGDTVECIVNKMSGVVLDIHMSLNGEHIAYLSIKGKPTNRHYFDVANLRIIKKGKELKEQHAGSYNGKNLAIY